MKKLLIAMLVAGFSGQVVSAQEPGYYTCSGKSARISVASMPLDEALSVFTKIYRCPVSNDAGKVGDIDAGQVTTTVTKGRYTPDQALKMMIRNTPFKSSRIKGGFSITQ